MGKCRNGTTGRHGFGCLEYRSYLGTARHVSDCFYQNIEIVWILEGIGFDCFYQNIEVIWVLEGMFPIAFTRLYKLFGYSGPKVCLPATVLAFPHRFRIYTGPKVYLLATVLAFPHRSMFYVVCHRSVGARSLQAGRSARNKRKLALKKVLFFMTSGNQRKTSGNLLLCLPVQSNNVVDKQH